MKAFAAGFAAIVMVVALGCKEKSTDKARVATTQPVDSGKQGAPEQQPKANDWIPAEYKSGKGEWRDAGAYVDGVAVGMFWFGELPSTLKPVWVEEIEGLDFGPGDPPPHERVIKVRRYRFSDYLEAVGVDLQKIQAIHFYGPNGQILPLSGKEFLAVKDIFYFRFGLGTHGKVIPVVPKDVGRNYDRLQALAVYVEKKPPTVSEDEDGNLYLVLDGKPVEGIPYFGEPLRGGIRIYKDDHLINVIKRNQLDPKMGEKGADGETRWKLLATLESLGIPTQAIVQLEVIYDERRTTRLNRAELQTMTFRSTSQGRGQLELDDKIPVHALALYSKPLPEKTAAKDPDDSAGSE